MLRRFVVLPALALVLPGAGAAQARAPSIQAQYDSGYFAWQAGDYVAALTQFERMLGTPAVDPVLGLIAELTGEVFASREVAPDGNSLRWSRDGRMVSYQTVAGAARTLHLVSVSGPAPREVAAFAGSGLVFSPTRDEAAYLSATETPALAAARATLDSLIGAQDFQGAARQRGVVAGMEAAASKVRVRVLSTGREREVPITGFTGVGVAYGRDGALYLISGVAADPTATDIVALNGPRPRAVSQGPGRKEFVGASATHLVYAVGGTITLRSLATDESRPFAGRQAELSADASTLTYVGSVGSDNTINVVHLATGQESVAKQTPWPLANPAVSADGQVVSWQMMPREDWEIYVASSDGSGEARLTREIQDDWAPRFLGAGDRMLGLIGEGRHRRSYLYDLATGTRTRLHHNNTLRTVAPEYEWAPSPDGSKLLVVADRDGNTISPERGVYLLDLSRRVTRVELLERVRSNLAAERDLRMRGERMFAGIAARIRPVVADVSVSRIYQYFREIDEFDSRWIAQPGNQKALEYLVARLKSWGYEPEVQWFEPRPGIRTANVIATLTGTRYPDRIYVISSHFDSVERGPGMDDNLSGSMVTLEAARVMAGHPQPATVKFALLTGEEAGTLGAREFVRRARANGDLISGVLNNDMVGWANDERIDNTIRYSSAYLRDVEHTAAIQFSQLITYDAKYYRGTDAGPFYEAYGEVVAGMGGFPILGSPHYHETHDVIETIAFPQVAETAKATVASIMLMSQEPELPQPAS